MKLGFIGLGVMGRPMAENLLRAGHELLVWARRAESAQPLLDLGARVLPSPEALAREVDVLFVVVTASADVEQVLLGAQGALHGLRPGAVVVDHSTIAPAAARRIAAALARCGADFLDAPVSGGGVGAANATLSIMVGGEAAALARVRPLLEKLGKTIVHVGPSGAGQVAKACNQMVMVAAIQACAEAARLADAHGVDFGPVREAMLAGSAGSRVLDVFGGRMARRDFAAGVEARLHHKDYALFMDEAARLGAPLPVAAQVWQQLNGLMARGWGRDDSAGLLRLLEAP
ncbi:MAG: NAD(P)-dependent oxidoreductase [Sterolibacteriaceae bacterium MAG5]|nr:NAD(P)-dependent oxidoreductase [Candidatus Nitricoxidireducens bremensis]